MKPLDVVNACLALTLELWMLWAYGAWGWHMGGSGWVGWSAMLGAVGLGIGCWAIWGAPKSARRLRAPGLYVFKACMFAAAGGALFTIGRPIAASVFLALTIVHLTFTVVRRA
jgi:hypothetical protein